MTEGVASFVAGERSRQAAWKASTRCLPEEARPAAAYVGKDGVPTTRPLPFCLPAEFAGHNLLPEVRDISLALFTELGIPWHAGVAGGPSNPLLSSQVQCVNALGQMVADSSRIRAAFGGVVDIAEVLEIEPGRFLTFEFIGLTDYFGEATDGERVRGARCTSVDAAFRFRDSSGATELALVEWKYTESYRLVEHPAAKAATRRARYFADYEDAKGPIERLLDFDLVQDEPFYQLVRQQLLAQRLESDQAEPAERVRVLHVLDPRNLAYQASLARPEQRELGATVDEAWEAMLRAKDRFLHVDPVVFLDPAITSNEYVARYG